MQKWEHRSSLKKQIPEALC